MRFWGLWLSAILINVSFAGGKTMDGPRDAVHPRPDFERATWVSLDGPWDFAYDDGDAGVKEKWFEAHDWSRKIRVPFAYQAKLSGIGETEHHRVVWYHRQIGRPNDFARDGHVRLHFGAADFRATVWLNGVELGEYEGGFTPFSFDIEQHLRDGANNSLVVRIFDDALDPAQPRGKQHPSGKLTRWHYTHITGLWQSVWLESVPQAHVAEFRVLTPEIADPMPVSFRVGVRREKLASPQVRVTLLDGRRKCASQTVDAATSSVTLQLDVKSPVLWSPDKPHLYNVRIELLDGNKVVDSVRSYVGLRTIQWGNGKYMLNGKPLWLNGALDQGYWPDGILTAPNDAALRRDVEFARAVGLNMVRMHQKVADPRYLYWCDKLGLMVWGEMANAGEGHFSKRAGEIALREWERVIARDANHPCIIAWVYSNESWMHGGRNAEEREHYIHAYDRLRTWDASRPVIDTSGWFHVKTDIFDFHGVPELKNVQAWLAGTLKEIVFRPDVCYFDKEKPDLAYHGWPLVVSEWATGDFKKADEEYYRKYEASILALAAAKAICGQIYVQLYDVENELNGYLSYGRKWKVDPKRIKAIHEKFAAAAGKE